jgi:hypothetical protein
MISKGQANSQYEPLIKQSLKIIKKIVMQIKSNKSTLITYVTFQEFLNSLISHKVFIRVHGLCSAASKALQFFC